MTITDPSWTEQADPEGTWTEQAVPEGTWTEMEDPTNPNWRIIT